jgi:serine/threonine protein kinase
MADILSYVHSTGIVHGDVKLGNILVSKEFNLVLCDFGFSFKNSSNSVFGSEGYTAPEIFSEIKDPFKCDVFSLGVVYFILATGNIPFMSNNPD